MSRKLLKDVGLIVLAVFVTLKTILGFIGDAEVIANFGTPGTLPNNLMKWFVRLPAWGFFMAGAAFVVLAFWDRLFGKSILAPMPPEQKVVPRIVSEVLDDNFVAFCARLEAAVGSVIGLHVSMSKPIEPRDAVLGSDGGVYMFNGTNVEINTASGATFRHGDIIFDGFWMVKYGGMHQGVRSVYLEHVADAGILLNPAITVVDEYV